MHLQTSGANQDSDPQVSLLSKIFYQDHHTMRLTLSIIIAVLVELGSSLGLYLSAGHRICKTGNEDTPDHQPQLSVRTVLPDGEIEDFCLDCLKHDETKSLGLDVLFSAYKTWCTSQAYMPLPKHDFAEKFHDLAQEIGIAFTGGEYREITLMDGVNTCATHHPRAS